MSNESEKYIREFIVNRVSELMAANQIKSKKALSELIGHSETLITNLLKRKHIPSIVIIYDLCNHFGITLSDFFRIDFSKDKSAEALLKLISDKYEPETITMMYDAVNNVEPELVKASLKTFSDYRQSKNRKENERI